MSDLSYRLARAVDAGRRTRWRPMSREQILARLLVRRADAKQAGLHALERSLRKQIAWALPIRKGDQAGRP